MQKLLATIAFAILIITALSGCDPFADPGPAGQTYIYENHVEVITKNQAPPMNDPVNEIWDNVPISIFTIRRDSSIFTGDNETMTLRLSAIRYSDRIYVRALWGYDDTYSVSPQYAEFTRYFNYDNLDTSITFTYAVADSHYYYPTANDSILVRDYALDQETGNYTPRNTSGDSIFQAIQVCTPVGDSADTVVVVTDSIWEVYPAFTCSTWVDTLTYVSTAETWSRKAALDYDTTFSYRDTVIVGTDTTITDYFEYGNSGADQDRLAIMWDMGNNGTEGANCMTMCHDVGMESTLGQRMYTTGGGTVDVWHWQSALSNPLYLAVDEIWADSGHTADDGSSMIYESNWDEANLRPIYMHQTDTAYHNTYLLSTETASFDTTHNLWPQGYVIPTFVLNEMATGPATDVSSYSWYTSLNTWYVLMSRKLNTGDPDDVNLSTIATGDSIMTSVAIMNNVEQVHMYIDEPIYFIFK